MKQNKRIEKVVFWGSLENKIDQILFQKYFLYTTQVINSSTHCGIIAPEYFTVHTLLFSESQNYNTCLNRKISVDWQGEIKNCPSMGFSYGNVKKVALNSVVHNAGFRSAWSISKNAITTCKECEFRHICTDCRAFIENPNDIYSKPLKCGYDPYTNRWEDWSTNPLKQRIFEEYKTALKTSDV